MNSASFASSARSGLVTPLKASVRDLEFGVEIAAIVVSAEMVHPGVVVIGDGGKRAEHDFAVLRVAPGALYQQDQPVKPIGDALRFA